VSGGASGATLALERKRRWPVPVDDPLEASGFVTALGETVPAELVAGIEAVWLTPEL
jgi:hypothetical protein